MRYDSRQFYLKSREEMDQAFAEIPEAVTNTSAVAEMCDVKLPFGENHYPVFERPLELTTREDPDNFDRILDIYVEQKNAVLTRDGKEPIKTHRRNSAGNTKRMAFTCLNSAKTV